MKAAEPDLTQYRETILEQQRALNEGNARKANRLYDRLLEMRQVLTATEEGRARITDMMMTDRELAVVLHAATDTLFWSPREARRVLKRIERKNGDGALTAKYTLQEFDAGRLRPDR